MQILDFVKTLNMVSFVRQSAALSYTQQLQSIATLKVKDAPVWVYLSMNSSKSSRSSKN